MHNIMHIFRIALLPVLVIAGIPGKTIAAPRLYDVEVIIFSHSSLSNTGENWQTPAPGAGRARGKFRENQFTELSSSRFKLNPVRYSLQQGGDYAVLYHRAWRQLAHNAANAADYPVHSFSENSRNSIEGTIRLVRERYLHLNVDLLLMESSGSEPGLYSDGPGNKPAYRLVEKRRIKSSELHYFDHPKFGMLVMVTPYQSPVTVAPETHADSPVTETDAGTDNDQPPAETGEPR